jgi:uncharacterized membrane protein YdjX (TVP38/TMEM64 family)
VLVVLIITALFLHILHPHSARDVLGWIRAYPLLAPVIFVFVGATATTLVLPTGLPMNLAAGLMWGGLVGGTLTSIAASISAAAAFALSRRFGAGVVERLSAQPALEAMVATVEERDLLFIVLSRANPLVPYAIASYLFGLTRIRFSRYMLATMITNAPAAILVAYIGESIGDITLPADQMSQIRAVGLLLTLVTLALLLRYALPRIRDRRSGRNA